MAWLSLIGGKLCGILHSVDQSLTNDLGLRCDWRGRTRDKTGLALLSLIMRLCSTTSWDNPRWWYTSPGCRRSSTLCSSIRGWTTPWGSARCLTTSWSTATAPSGEACCYHTKPMYDSYRPHFLTKICFHTDFNERGNAQHCHYKNESFEILLPESSIFSSCFGILEKPRFWKVWWYISKNNRF